MHYGVSTLWDNKRLICKYIISFLTQNSLSPFAHKRVPLLNITTGISRYRGLRLLGSCTAFWGRISSVPLAHLTGSGRLGISISTMITRPIATTVCIPTGPTCSTCHLSLPNFPFAGSCCVF